MLLFVGGVYEYARRVCGTDYEQEVSVEMSQKGKNTDKYPDAEDIIACSNLPLETIIDALAKDIAPKIEEHLSSEEGELCYRKETKRGNTVISIKEYNYGEEIAFPHPDIISLFKKDSGEYSKNEAVRILAYGFLFNNLSTEEVNADLFFKIGESMVNKINMKLGMTTRGAGYCR